MTDRKDYPRMSQIFFQNLVQVGPGTCNDGLKGVILGFLKYLRNTWDSPLHCNPKSKF